MLRNLKSIALAVAVSLLLVGTAVAAELSADVVQKRMGQETKGKAFIKGGYSRMDLKMMGQDITIITRPDHKKVYMLQHSAKMAMTMKLDDSMATGEWNEKDLKTKAKIRNLGTEQLNGYKCDKKEVIYNDKQMGRVTVWVARKLKMPIKTHTKTDRGEMETEYRNIKTGSVKSSVFDIPKGYSQMEMPKGMDR